MKYALGISVLAAILLLDFIVFRKLGVARYFLLLVIALLALNYFS
jgi:hypothetical protein